jgi:quercetin dioxygenase-like cupin family protein
MIKKIARPTVVEAAGNKKKIIEEYFGLVNSKDDQVSIAVMRSPSGWIEPGQTPGFDEYTVVLKGMLQVETHAGKQDVRAGEAIFVSRGELAGRRGRRVCRRLPARLLPIDRPPG